MRFDFVTESAGPQRLYRATLVAEGLRALGHDAQVWNACFEAQDHRLVGWQPLTGVRRTGPPADVVVGRWLQRPAADQVILRAREAGQFVALDIDDDIWGLPDWHPSWRVRDDPTIATLDTLAVQLNMAAADVVLVSTEPLGEVVMTVLDTLEEPDTPVALVRAPVEVTDLVAPLTHRPLRVGWLGNLAYRGHDLALITDVLAEVLPAHQAVLFHLGRDRAEPPLPVALGMSAPYIIRERDWVDVNMLPAWLAELDCAVIPAEAHRFNLCRSANTGLALGAVGVPFVTSPSVEYCALEAEGIGWVAHTPEDWRRLLGDLLDGLAHDFASIDVTRSYGRDQVRELHGPTTAAQALLDVVQTMLADEAAKGDAGPVA